MNEPKLDRTNIIILYNNAFRAIADMLDAGPRQDGGYSIWLCQDLKTGWYHVRAEPANAPPPERHNPVERLGVWSPNRDDPGSLYIHLLEKIKEMFQVENILPGGWRDESNPSPTRAPDLPPGIA